MIDRVSFSTGSASGSAGSATSTGYSVRVAGKILAVDVKYNDSPPSTTDFTLSDEGGETILSLSDANTDVRHYPRRKVQDNTGADVTFDGINEIYEPYVVVGRLKAVIAQADSDDSVTVTVFLES